MALKHPIERYFRNRNTLSRRGWVLLIVVAVLLGGGVVFYMDIAPQLRGVSDREAALQTLTYLEGLTAPEIIPTEIRANPTPVPISFEPTEQRIIFPDAETAGKIVPVYLKNGNWDVSNLQQLVGHLERTAWLDRPGNIVLVGHFEDQYGNPGPFRYLYSAQIGDRILLQDGDISIIYEVTEVFSTSPDDLEVLRNTETPRLTLITCDDWNYTTKVYDERLIVVAEPVETIAVGQ